MNNRKDFLRWLEKDKQLSKSECKSKMWGLDSLQRSEHLFDICSVDELNGIDTKEDLSLYREYLLYAFPISQAESNEDDSDNSQSTVIAEISGEIPDDITETKTTPNGIFEETDDTDYNNIDLSEEVKAVLDSDYNQKKEVKQRLKKESFSLLSEIYDGAYASSGLDNNKDICQASVSKRPPVLVFDVVSAQCYDLANQEHAKMKTYVKYDTGDNAKIFQRTDKAFYYSYNLPEQESSAVAFLKNKPSLDVIQRALTDTIASYQSISTEYRIVCLVPDNLGDFKDNIKSQIKSVGSIIQIPRSIAAAYSFVAQNNIKSDSTFVCYDYGSSELCKTQIRILYDEENKCYEFTRMWRQRYPQKQRQYFDKIALTYLEKYSSKNRIHLSDAVKKTLINTRDIVSVLSGTSSIAIATEIGYISIDYDKEIVGQLVEEMQADTLIDPSNEDYSCILFDANTQEEMCYSFADLCVGFTELHNRIKNKKTIWNEYLPELSLEVIQEGHFGNLQLIRKGDYQDISIDSMDNEIEIPLENGSFSLPGGKEKVFIPLTREEFGNLQRDKMAMFEGEELLHGESSIPVNLKLSYRYGDPNSYKLIALTESGIEFQSEWCEQEDMHIDEVFYPDFKNEEQIAIKDADIEYMENFIEGLSIRMSQIFNRTFKLQVKEQDDYQESNIFDGIRLPYERKYYYCNRKLLKNITSVDNVQNNQRCRQFLINIINSKAYSAFLDFLINEESSEIARIIGTDKKLRRAVSVSINNFMSMLGSYYLLTNKNIVNDKEELIMHFMNKGMEEYLVNASRCILEDSYGLFKYIGENIENKCVIKDVRNISSVCWLNPEWIFELYQATPEAIDTIINTIYSYLTQQAIKEIIPKTLKVRDVLEVALSICRLRKVNPNILNPNDKRTREMVASVKQIDEIARENRSSLKREFVSRVKYDREDKFSDGLGTVTDPCYLLITQLSSSRQLNLIGFTDD